MSKDRLFELIHTLNPSEKRYFKQFSKRHSSKNDSSKLVLLFDLLSQSKSYNAAEIISKSDFIRASQLQNMRVRLYNALLTSLRNYYSDTSPKIQLHQLMIDHEVLLKKGLYRQAWKHLLKAEKIALDNGVFFILEDILNHQEYLTTIRLKNKNVKRNVIQIQEKRAEINTMRHDLSHLNQMGQALYSIFKSEGRFIRTKNYRDEIRKILSAIENRSFSSINSFQICYNFHYNLSLGYRLMGDTKMAIAHCGKIQALFYNEIIILKNPKVYQKFLNLYVILCNETGNFGLATELIYKIRNETKHFELNMDMRILIFENAVFQEIESFIQRKDFDKAVSIINENSTTIDELKTKIHTVNQQSKFYRIALANFGAGHIKSALRWVNEIINRDEIKYRKDILSSVEILNLLIHYELKNYDLLINRLKTTREHLKKIDRLLFPERALLLALNQIVDNGKSEKATFKTLINELRENEVNHPLDRHAMAYFNLTDWLERKIARSSKLTS